MRDSGVLSTFIDRFLPSRLRADPEQHPHARATVGGLYAAAPFVFFLALEQHLSYGMWSVTIPVLAGGVGFLAIPWLFHVLPPQRVRDVGALVIYLTIFAVGAARGGLRLSLVTWNFVLIFGAGLFSRKPMTVLWGVLILLQMAALYALGEAEVLPYVESTMFQKLFSVSTLLAWSVIMAVLVAQARDQRDVERRRLAEQVDTLRRIQALGRLSGGIAHDFNNLLTVVSSHASLLRQQLRDPTDVEDLQAIEQAARRGRDFTARLLALTRGEPEPMQVVDLAEQLRGFSRLVRLAVAEGVQLQVELQEGSTAHVDRAALEQVLLNACMNAADALPDGGTVRLSAQVVEVDTPQQGVHGQVTPGRWVCVSVQDDGVGMTPDVLEHMFDAFFTTKSRADGTGIGLSTAMAAVQRMDGQLMVDSHPGRGTTFRVLLPWQPALPPTTPTEPSDAPEASAAHGLRVLLADDESSVRRAVRRLLERHGFQVTEVADGAEALEHVEADPTAYDLVLTDVVMPKMTGIQLAEAARQVAPDLPFVFVSGYADGPDRVTLSSTDARFVQKPFAQATLLRTLHDAVSAPPPLP